ncbi:transposase family protein [Streptomyces massasporeus]|uniref:transposase family protein n=1 Tax=Streptomyces massasporeus TaxID=67324 RepID=UPI003456B5DE
MSGVITASESSWIAPFTGLSPRVFAKLMRQLRGEGGDTCRRGQPWSLPLEDRVLLVSAYWRTNLTLRQLAPLFGISKSAADHAKDEELPAWKQAHNKSHKQVRARVEHVFARMKTWKVFRDCRLKGDGVHHAVLGIARLHNLALTG